MAGLTKRGNKFYAVWRDEAGIVRKKGLGTSDPAKAAKLLREFEDEQRLGRIDPAYTHRKTSLAEHLADYCAHRDAQRFTPKSTKQARSYILRLIQATNARRAADLTPSRVRAALAGFHVPKRVRGETPLVNATTRNAYLKDTKAFLSWMLSDKRITENPLAGMKRENEKVDQRHPRRALTDDEFAALLDAAEASTEVVEGFDGTTRAKAYLLARLTGLRRQEIASLTPASFTLERRNPRLVVQAAHSKHRRQDVVPIHLDLLRRLREWLRGLPDDAPIIPRLAKRRTSMMMQRDLVAAGVAYRDARGRYADFHALRHSFITSAWRSGARPDVVMRLARHASLDMTMRYSHTSDEDVADAMRAMPGVARRSGR